MDTGWVNVKGKMYYHNLSNGSLVKGWIQDQNGYEYYLSEADGALVTNCTIAIQGRNYTFDDTAETEYDEPFTKEEKLEFLDNLIEDIKAYKLKITNEAEQEE